MTTTAELLAAISTAPKLPPGAVERDLVDAICSMAPRSLPDLTEQQVGEALMHFMPIFHALHDRIHEMDPMLDRESIANIAINVLGVAGMELYTGKAVA